MKRIIALILAVLCVGLCSCGKAEEQKIERKKHSWSHEKSENTENVSEEETEEEEIEEVEVVYAKTPEEAANKCINAFKAGKLSDARHYVTPNGDAFKELGMFRQRMVKSFGVDNNRKLEAQAERLVNNVLKKYVYTKTKITKNESKATITYSVSMPDMASIDYSRYSSAYMASQGITQEVLMMQLEGMSEKEAEQWAKEYSLDVLNYIFESGAAFARTTGTTIVTVEKHKSGWLVSDIVNK